MKRLCYIVLVAIMLCLSCQPNDPTNTPLPTSSKLNILLPSITRLSLGDGNGSKYPIVWSEDDKVSANGVISEAIEILSNQKAVFSFSDNIEYPCAVIYPHDIRFEGNKAIANYPIEQYYN